MASNWRRRSSSGPRSSSSKRERVCTGRQRECDVAQDVEGGLAVGGLVAADVGDVDAHAVGQGLLGQATLFAEGDESLGEVHDVDGHDGARLDHTGRRLDALT